MLKDASVPGELIVKRLSETNRVLDVGLPTEVRPSTALFVVKRYCLNMRFSHRDPRQEPYANAARTDLHGLRFAAHDIQRPEKALLRKLSRQSGIASYMVNRLRASRNVYREIVGRNESKPSHSRKILE